MKQKTKSKRKTKSAGKRTAVKKKTVSLTDKEIAVINLVCQEYSSAEIGKKLGLSGKTIENRIFDILRKIKSKNRVGIVIYAIKNKIYKLK